MTSNVNEYITSSNFHMQRYIKMGPRSISTTISDTCNNRSPVLTKIEKSAMNQSVWFPAIVTTLIAGKNTNKNGINCKSSKQNNLFFYPVFQQHQQFTRSSALRTELRVARTIGIVVGCFIVCWLPFTIIYVLQVIQIKKILILLTF